MPAFVVEFDSNYGPERRLFTLDSDRTLRPQMVQVLEELRLSNRVLAGGPEDELGVYWNGEELDQDRPLEALGISTDRPVVLRMRARCAVPTSTASAVNWHGILRPPFEGALGALLAWFATSPLIDMRRPLTTPDEVDLVVSFILAAGIGVGVMLGSLARREVAAGGALSLILAAPLSGFATLLGILVVGQTPSVTTFMAGRILAWSLTLALLSLMITAPRRALPSGRWMSALGIGALSGAVAALVMSLPGPTLVWQAIAFLLAGLGVGVAAIGYSTWQAQSRVASPAGASI